MLAPSLVISALCLSIRQVAGETPWSLLQQKALVKGSLGTDVSSADEALIFVQGLAEKVVGHNVPLSEDEKSAIKAIYGFIKRLLKDIKLQQAEDQKEVENYKDAVQQCADMTKSALDQLANTKDEVNWDRKSHTDCRKEQAGFHDTRARVCSDYDNYRMTPPGNSPPKCMNSLTSKDISTTVPATKKSMESCIVEIYMWVKPLYQHYINCKKNIDIVDDKADKCDKKQHTFESEFCQYSALLTDTCNHQTDCREATIDQLKEGFDAVSVSEKARETDCVVAHKVECLLKIFEEEDNAKKPDMLKHCKAMKDSEAECPAGIKYPEIPKPVDCHEEPNEPCEKAWLEKEYETKDWYSKAPTTDCMPCMHPGPSTLYVWGFSKYPGYHGDLEVSGQVTIRMGHDGTQILTWSLAGVDSACATPKSGEGIKNACGVHIHEGTSCHEAGGHLFKTDEDPWLKTVYVAKYRDTANVVASEQNTGVEVMTGLTSSDIKGKVFVVHALESGTRIACGMIGTETGDGNGLTVSSLHPYPGYSGLLKVSGSIMLSGVSGNDQTAMQRLKWTLEGADAECKSPSDIGKAKNGCGIHVHAGTSCDQADAVGGHYYNDILTKDPWLSVGYTVQHDGKSTVGEGLDVLTGLSQGDITGRVMVVHSKTGERIACGLIEVPPKTAGFFWWGSGDTNHNEDSRVELYTFGAPKVSFKAWPRSGCFTGYRAVNFDGSSKDLVPWLMVTYSHPSVKSLQLWPDRSEEKECGWQPSGLWATSVALHDKDLYADRVIKFASQMPPEIADVGLRNSYNADLRQSDVKRGWKLVTSATVNGFSIFGNTFADQREVSHLYQHPDTLECMLSFEGTDRGVEWTDNLSVRWAFFCGFGFMHKGFKSALLKMADSEAFQTNIRPKLGLCKKISVVGHSLGGAMATFWAGCVISENHGNEDYEKLKIDWQEAKQL